MQTHRQRATEPGNSFEPIPFRIRVGVTGHRTLPDAETVRISVLNAIQEFAPALFPANTQLRVKDVLAAGHTGLVFSVLSPLAEGTDRVVAQTVLELPESRLEVVLPMPVDEYKKDFASAESCAEFDALLARCPEPMCLSAARVTTNCGSQPAFDRKVAYEAAGRYVVNHCDILLAIWDGQPARGRGGTAKIVAYAMEQEVPVLHLWNGQAKLHNPAKFTPLDAEALFALDRWNRMNVQQSRHDKAFRDQDDEFFGPLAGKEPGADQMPVLPDAAKQLVRTRMLTYYARGSAIAEACRDQYLGGGWKIYTFSAAAVLFAALGTILGEVRQIFHRESVAQVCFLVEFFLLAIMVVKLKRTHRAQTHPGWLENRFLTERIRCAAFLAVCGVKPEPIEVPAFMGAQEIDRGWLARVLDEMQFRLPRLTLFAPAELEGLRQFISQRWLQDQIAYHQEKARNYQIYLHRLTRAGEIIVPTTIVVALLHVCMGSFELEFNYVWLFRGFFTLLALVLPAVAAALAGIETYREFKRLSVRSSIMARRIEQLDRRLTSASTPDEFLVLLHKIDKVMLQETQDWMTLMRHVEIKAG